MGLVKLLSSIKSARKLLRGMDFTNEPQSSLAKILDFCKKNPEVDEFLKITQTYELILRAQERAEQFGWPYAAHRALGEFGINYEIEGKEKIPDDKSCIYVANHLYGIPEATIFLSLGGMVREKGRDYKIVADHSINLIRGIENEIILVDKKERNNIYSLKKMISHLEGGGDLFIFPSGKQSGPNLREKAWKSSLGRLVRHAECVVPMWFNGPNHSTFYNIIQRFLPSARDAFISRETWNKKGKTIELRVGDALPSQELIKEYSDNGKLTKHLRLVSESLKR